MPSLSSCPRYLPVMILSLVVPGLLSAKEPPPLVKVSKARPNPRGILVHSVQSPYEKGTTEIHVLLPRKATRPSRLRVVYVLPVEAGNGQRWGDAMAEVLKHDLHNRHGIACVYPTFSHLPWYTDHPDDPTIRQEEYFLKVVVPFVEKTYPVEKAAGGRLLVGFSKSGWGAWSLLLRHPTTFARAAAWDAPLMTTQPNRYGMGPIFGTQENFERYQITRLLDQRRQLLKGDPPRLILTGYGNFHDQHKQAHSLLKKLEISHTYRDGPRKKHAWGSGWLSEAVKLLTSDEIPGDDLSLRTRPDATNQQPIKDMP